MTKLSDVMPDSVETIDDGSDPASQERWAEDMKMFLDMDSKAVEARIIELLVNSDKLNPGDPYHDIPPEAQMPPKQVMIELIAELPMTLKMMKQENVEPNSWHALHMTMVMRLMASVINYRTIQEVISAIINSAQQEDDEHDLFGPDGKPLN